MYLQLTTRREGRKQEVTEGGWGPLWELVWKFPLTCPDWWAASGFEFPGNVSLVGRAASGFPQHASSISPALPVPGH